MTEEGRLPQHDSWIKSLGFSADSSILKNPLMEVFGEGTLFDIPFVGQFYVRSTGEIVFRKFPQATDQLFRWYKQSTIDPYVNIYQGDLVLHGSAVLWQNKVVALIGNSGSGKSTFTQEFLNKGAVLIAEDDLIFEKNTLCFLKDEGFIKLYGEQVRPELGVGERIYPHSDKFIFKIDNSHLDKKYELDTFILLGWDDQLSLTPVQNFQQKIAFLHQCSKGSMISEKVDKMGFFNTLLNLAKSKPVLKVSRPKDGDMKEAFERMLEMYTTL